MQKKCNKNVQGQVKEKYWKKALEQIQKFSFNFFRMNKKTKIFARKLDYRIQNSILFKINSANENEEVKAGLTALTK